MPPAPLASARAASRRRRPSRSPAMVTSSTAAVAPAKPALITAPMAEAARPSRAR